MAGRAPSSVAIVVPCLSGAGAQRVAETLAREFARSTRVTVVTVEPRLTRAELAGLDELPWADRIPPGCRHVHLPSTGSGLRRFGQVVAGFSALARRERFDAVYSFLTWTNVVVSAARAAGGGYLHVASEHAMAESLRSDGAGLSLLARTLPVVYRRPDRIVVVSDAAARSLAEEGLLPHPDRVVTIPNPVDAAEVRRLAGASEPGASAPGASAPGASAPGASRPAEERVLVCVARLHPQKDHLTLLRALRRCRTPSSCGSSARARSGRSWRRRSRTWGLTGRVTFTGQLANPYPVVRRPTSSCSPPGRRASAWSPSRPRSSASPSSAPPRAGWPRSAPPSATGRSCPATPRRWPPRSRRRRPRRYRRGRRTGRRPVRPGGGRGEVPGAGRRRLSGPGAQVAGPAGGRRTVRTATHLRAGRPRVQYSDSGRLRGPR